MSIVWDLGVMEWVAAGRKFAIKLASASVLTVVSTYFARERERGKDLQRWRRGRLLDFS